MSFALVIPCYNFAAGLPATFERLSRWRASGASKSAVTVYFVDDGSTDDTPGVLERLAAQAPDWVRVVKLPENRGKGAALRAGFTSALADPKARHEQIVFTDCDLHYGLEIIGDRILPALGQADVVIVDRTWCESARHERPMRRVASGVFNRAVQVLTGVVYRDCQAGLKGFRVDTCRPLLALLRLDSFACDVEMLSIALYYRLRIQQIPVSFRRSYEFPETSSVKLMSSSVKMLFDLLRINLNWKAGRYQSPELEGAVARLAYRIEET